MRVSIKVDVKIDLARCIRALTWLIMIVVTF